MAISSDPKLLIADEPTTALDVTIQKQILVLLKSLQKQKGMSIILVTHDLGVVSEYSDRIQVMYAGEMVETGATTDVISQSKHPYTNALLNSRPGGKNRIAKHHFLLLQELFQLSMKDLAVVNFILDVSFQKRIVAMAIFQLLKMYDAFIL